MAYLRHRGFREDGVHRLPQPLRRRASLLFLELKAESSRRTAL